MDALKKLRLNYMETPNAIDEQHPVFSWQMESDRQGACQKAYQIVVRKGNMVCWDSGKVKSDASVEIVYPELLEAETDYNWTLCVWNEQGKALTAESCFATGLMDERLEAWHGAQWIGPDEITFAAETVPVFRLCFTMTVEKGGSRAGIVFGANDPRLLSSIHNNYLIHGENYVTYELNVSQIPAVLEVYRKGYQPEEDGTVPAFTVEIPEEIIDAENRFGAHAFEIVISGNQMEYMTIDGQKLHTGVRSPRIMPGAPKEAYEETHLILNPLGEVMDMPIYPRLCNVGFITDSETRAFFNDYQIRHYGGAHQVIFGEKTGETYQIFAEKAGVKIQDSQITVAPGTLVYADPSHAGLPMLRKEFTIGKKVCKAKVYATAQGIFEMTINGKKVGDEFLTPGDTDFRQHILYQAFDVTDMIQEGANAIGAVLASGWFGDQTSYTIENYNYYGDTQAFLGLLALTYENGTTEYIPTDASWQYYGEGPWRYAGNFNGETYDATKEIPGWNRAGFDTSAWRAATVCQPEVCGYLPKITAKIDPGMTFVETLHAKFVSKEVRGTDNDTVYLYNMGINMVGVPRITFPKGERGRKVTIRYAEILYPHLDPENEFYYGDLGGLMLTENLRGALVTDVYIMKGEENEVYEPRFTFHGYQYIEISGIDEALPEENIIGLVYSSVRQASFFESSNPLTNQLFTNIIRSTLGNHLSIPTDCPQRDERLGWAGDANVYTETATYMSDMSAFYRNFNMLQRDAQGKDGTFHLYAPMYAPVGEAFALGYTWNAAGVTMPFQTFLQYGSLKVLQENYPNMKKHVEGMEKMTAEGRKYLSDHIGWLGDHLSVTDTDASLMDNAQFYKSVRYTQKAAEILGYAEDAASFKKFGDDLQKEWNEVFVGADHRTYNAKGILQDTQASYALPLMCGVFNEENRPYAQKYLSEACAKTGYTMTTGFMGTAPLLPALTEAGEIETAFTMFEQTGYPSWLYPVVQGATSIWERWSSYTIENGFGGQNRMNSFNHYSLGGVGAWMMEYLAGIQRDGTSGFKSFVLQPVSGGHFTHVKASYESVYGTICSAWTAEDGVMKSYDCTVPANTTAVLYLPVGAATGFEEIVEHNGVRTAKIVLGPGSYHFAM